MRREKDSVSVLASHFKACLGQACGAACSRGGGDARDESRNGLAAAHTVVPCKRTTARHAPPMSAPSGACCGQPKAPSCAERIGVGNLLQQRSSSGTTSSWLPARAAHTQAPGVEGDFGLAGL